MTRLCTGLLSLVFLANAAGSKAGDLPIELGLGGVGIDDDLDTVVKKLGQPLRHSYLMDFISHKLEYSQMQVGLSGDLVAVLYSEDPTACTPQGLCPGDTLRKMRKLYGSPVIADRETGKYYEYHSKDSPCWYQIAGYKRRVKSVSAVCQP